MRGHNPRIIHYRGSLTSIADLSKLSGINYQTLYDRWKRLGFPDDAPESMLAAPVQCVKVSGIVTLDGEPISIRALMKVSGMTVSTVYRVIKEQGSNLTTDSIRKDRSSSETIKIDVPEYDPNDRSPGWCERKYDFLRNAGIRRNKIP
jgi:predicted DNA-binding transcriptional regulator AlpA